MTLKIQTLEEWKADGEKLYGADFMNWEFICPTCKTILKPEMYKGHADSPETAYTDCIGRFIPDQGCDWAAYGLFGTIKRVIHPESGNQTCVFDFAREKELTA